MVVVEMVVEMVIRVVQRSRRGDHYHFLSRKDIQK